ncbi:MAG: four helix bundle protein [Patescibacteria group bacterium]
MESEQKRKINSFTDLVVWQEGHLLVLDIYKFSELFPQKEIFGLTNQIRRAAVSITSNISEGFSRQSIKEKVQFYYIAKGSLTEVQNQLLIARDVGFLKKDDFRILSDRSITVGKLLTGFIKKTKTFS